MKIIIPKRRNFLKTILFSLMGIITVSYNGQNYLFRNKKKKIYWILNKSDF